MNLPSVVAGTAARIVNSPEVRDAVEDLAVKGFKTVVKQLKERSAINSSDVLRNTPLPRGTTSGKEWSSRSRNRRGSGSDSGRSTPASSASSMSSGVNTPSTGETSPSSPRAPSSEYDHEERNYSTPIESDLLRERLEDLAPSTSDDVGKSMKQQIKEMLEEEIGKRPDLRRDLEPGLVDKFADILSDVRSGKITESQAREKMNSLRDEKSIESVKQLAAQTAFEVMVKLAMQIIKSIGELQKSAIHKMSTQG